MYFLRLPGKPVILALRMQNLKNILGKSSSNGGKVIARSFKRSQESDFLRGGKRERGQLEGVSFWCWMKLDDRGGPGGDPAVKAIRTQRDVPPFGNERAIASPQRVERSGPKAWPHSEGCRDRERGETHHHTLLHSQWKLNKQPIYQTLSALLSFSLSV